MESDLQKGYRPRKKDDLDSLVKNICVFRLMVKHPKVTAVIEIKRESACGILSQLHAQFKRMASMFGGARVERSLSSGASSMSLLWIILTISAIPLSIRPRINLPSRR